MTASTTLQPARWRDVFIHAQDGLRLHARDQGPTTGGRLPLICLPGLSRNAADFEEIADALASGPAARRVVSVDYRGRGLSDWDPNPANYDIRVENGDILALLAALDIGHAVFLGTSRGGLHIMAMTAIRPTVLAGAILNDIGPVIDLGGLMRIKSYVGRLAPPRTLADAAAVMERIADGGFPSFTADDWLRLARKSFVETNGRLAAHYDPDLLHTLDAYGPDTPPPALWGLFYGLAGVPTLAIRGENSDILSAQTLAAMVERRPDLETLVLPGQAHAPPLWEPDVIARIADFAERCDARTA